MKLFTPLQLGALSLNNRVVMAPLTRMRASEGDVPGELAAEYYSQRASAGLIISEAAQISTLGKGYPGTPGIYSDAQVAGWKKVTDAVHGKGGKMVCQLWHVGRISHSSLHPIEGLPVAPSAIAPTGKVYTATWQLAEYETPRPLSLSEIPALIQDYVHAAQQAKAAGFDGVEVHGANGYLLDQFLHDGSNNRNDQYGGSIENRSRLLLEVLHAVINVWGADRVGVRLSPYGTFNDMSDHDTMGLFTHLIGQLNPLGLAYLHLIEPRSTMAGGTDKVKEDQPSTSALFRPLYKGKIIAAGGFDREGAEQFVSNGLADAIAFGRFFISNPDLPKRLAENSPLNPYDRSTFYGGGAKGYVDYPSLG
ncbi:alkene reductase [Zwartia vadi]|uniref:alkene reductase n=1 Tax=Zwartia vadi TaxID=3058168 RepID=UPI0025B3A587|nr:alkene reductase [Zwartia vadi]MDN3988738.1 alkene reductase [Zwartia vadi]